MRRCETTKHNTDIQLLALTYKAEPNDRNFTKLVNGLDGPLYVFLSEYLNTHDDIRVVMTHTYEIMWLKFETYDLKYKFITWIFCIAKNIALNKRRMCGITYPISDHDINSICTIDFSDLIPSESEIKEEFYTEVINAIKSLQEPYCTSMYLKYIKNIKFSDIAEIIGDNSTTIRGRVHKAKRVVKEYISLKNPEVVNNMINIVNK